MIHQDAGGYPTPDPGLAPAIFEREPLTEDTCCIPQSPDSSFGGIDADIEGVGGFGDLAFDLGDNSAGTALAADTNSFEGLDTDGNDDQILIAAAVEHAGDAAQFENTAMGHDRDGNAKEAVANYLLAAEKLKQAASLCPEGLPDKAVLSRHAGEVLGRIVYLESLGGAPATAPLEQHIGRVTLTLGATPAELAGADGDGALHDEEAEAMGFATLDESGDYYLADESEGRPASLKKRAASAAAIAGGAGLLVLHAPIVACGLAGATAYAATRQDSAGRAARKVGDVGLQTASRAQSFAEEHRISERMNQAVGKVMSDRSKEKVASTVESLQTFNRKHQVTKTIGHSASAAGRGVASATSSLSDWVQKRYSR